MFTRSHVVLVLLLLLQLHLGGSSKAVSYELNDNVDVVANHIGPFSNPSETYPYYSVAMCPPEGGAKKEKHDIGEILVGDRKVNTPFKISFRKNLENAELCTAKLSKKEADRFVVAVEEEYFFEMFVDELPMWGFVGLLEESWDLGFLEGQRHYLYTHLQFNIGYNGKNIVSANVTTYNGNPLYKVDLTPHVEGVLDDADYEVTFTYGVTWYEDSTPYQQRMLKYADGGFVPKNLEIHWLSIINSFVLVILLTVFLGIILVRVLKNDFSRYMSLEDELEFQEEESGWKLIHGDVFRPPPFVSVFAAFLGGGAQLFVIGGSLICLALMGFFAHHNRGSIATAGIMLYAVTSCVSGFVSARWYRQLGGTNWVWNIVLSSVIFAGPLFFVFAWVNTTALTMKSTAALPVSTVMIIMALFLLVSFPLTVFGGIAGRNMAGDFDAPCRTKLKPRQIPPTPWFRSTIVQLCVAGFLPFSAIYIEMHYIFAAVWGHKVYTFFGILALALVMLLIVTSFVTISLTYFQLVGEDHTWWWRAFVSGGSTGGFIFAYCFYYFSQHSEMDGFMQTSFYFGYMALVSYGFFMMLGFVGFTSSLWFVKTIYRTIKVE